MRPWRDTEFVIPTDEYQWILDNTRGKSQQECKHVQDKAKRMAFNAKLYANHFIRKMIMQGKHDRAL